jgi:hypothetical protein
MAREQRFWGTERKVYLARLEEGRRAAQEPHRELQVRRGPCCAGRAWKLLLLFLAWSCLQTRRM